jgi:hypothetical protein
MMKFVDFIKLSSNIQKCKYKWIRKKSFFNFCELAMVIIDDSNYLIFKIHLEYDKSTNTIL